MFAEESVRKEFALNAIAPYYADPSKCAIVAGVCNYSLSDGRKCVVGQFIKDEVLLKIDNSDINELLEDYNEIDLFKTEAVGILNNLEWCFLQKIHDEIASGSMRINIKVLNLNLFTLEELQDKAKSLSVN